MKRLPMRQITPTLLLLTIALSPVAQATNGILPLGNGMTAHGLGGAGIANPADAMSGVDNPALLSETGDQMSLGLSIFSPLRSADLGNGYVDSESNYFPIPMFAWTKKATESMNWGILVTAMGGMNTDYPAKLMGVRAGIDLSGLIIAPTVSYKAANGASIGFSGLLGYEKFETTLPDNPPAPTKSVTKSDSATGTGVKFGVAIPLDEGTRLGAFYQSRIKMGEMSTHCNDADGMLSKAKANGIKCELNLAPMYGAGFKVSVSEGSNIVMDLIHVKWSDVDLFRQAFIWKDQNILKVGYERKANDTFTWRIGYNYAHSPVQDEQIVINPPFSSEPTPAGVLAPAITEKHFTFGITKKMGAGELVGYYAYVPEVEQTDTTGPGGVGTARVKMSQHALGIGYNWK